MVGLVAAVVVAWMAAGVTYLLVARALGRRHSTFGIATVAGVFVGAVAFFLTLAVT